MKRSVLILSVLFLFLVAGCGTKAAQTNLPATTAPTVYTTTMGSIGATAPTVTAQTVKTTPATIAKPQPKPQPKPAVSKPAVSPKPAEVSRQVQQAPAPVKTQPAPQPKPAPAPAPKPSNVTYVGGGYDLYHNPQFGFNFKFPSSFSGSDISGGMAFQNGSVRFSGYGYDNSAHDTAQSLLKKMAAQASQVGYVNLQQASGNIVYIGSVSQTTVFYWKAFVGTGAINVFTSQYPKSMAGSYSYGTITNSFVPGNLSASH